jgi:hypothetical protein
MKMNYVLVVMLLILFSVGIVSASGTEKEISLDDLDNSAILSQNLTPLSMLGKAYDEKARDTIITGYAVASYKYNDNGTGHHDLGNELHFGQDPADTSDFRFDVMEVGFTKRYSDFAWVAAALEVGLHNGHDGTSTEVELDAGEIHLVAPVGNGIDFAFGKFNSPVSFEQEDAPLLLQTTHSLTYQWGSPSKMVGLMATYPILENLEVRGAVFNGWNRNAGNTDNNKAKSLLFQVGYAPNPWLDTKFSYIWGAEQDDNDDDNRNVFDIATTLTPWRNWIFGFEASYGFDENQSAINPGDDAEWFTGQATVHHDWARWVGTTLRYSFLNDKDGMPDIDDPRKRTWHEVTFAQVFHISPEFLGYMGFGVIPKTQHLISGIDLRLEYRYDWINEAEGDRFFSDADGNKVSSTRNSLFAEVVASF